MEKFCAKNPTIEDYERELEKYDRACRELDNLNLFRVVGMTSILLFLFLCLILNHDRLIVFVNATGC